MRHHVTMLPIFGFSEKVGCTVLNCFYYILNTSSLNLSVGTRWASSAESAGREGNDSGSILVDSFGNLGSRLRFLFRAPRNWFPERLKASSSWFSRPNKVRSLGSSLYRRRSGFPLFSFGQRKPGNIRDLWLCWIGGLESGR